MLNDNQTSAGLSFRKHIWSVPAFRKIIVSLAATMALGAFCSYHLSKLPREKQPKIPNDKINSPTNPASSSASAPSGQRANATSVMIDTDIASELN